jgi:5-methylcytosine-specific restriction endonuclease McrA
MTTALPLNLGAPASPHRPPTWQETRREVIDRQRSRCFTCGLPFDRLDVVDEAGLLVALCRGDRVRRDAARRKAAHQKRRRRAKQAPLPIGGS